MVEVQEVVHLRLMELSWNSKSSSTDGTTTFLGDTTSVEAKIVDIVLLTLLLQLSEALLSIAAWGGSSHWHIT